MQTKRSKPILVAAFALALALTWIVTPASRATSSSSTSQVFLPSVSSSYRPIFFDNFDDPTSGWPVGSDSIANRAYLNGEYEIQVLQPNWIVLSGRSLYASDFEVEVNARTTSGSIGGFGLYFCSTPTGFCVFEVPNYAGFSFYGFGANGYGLPQIVGGIPNGNSGPPTQTYHLRMVRGGTNVTLYNGGQWITTISNITCGPGYVGIFAATDWQSMAPNTVLFDNFQLAYSASDAAWNPYPYFQRGLPRYDYLHKPLGSNLRFQFRGDAAKSFSER
jgi:hypothetical protein